jgi:hypothetical protein
MRRWTDPRDRTAWQVIYAPPMAEDPPSVRLEREGLVFRGDAGDFRAPAPYGWDLESLTEGDLQGLLDQARTAAEELHRTAGWGLPEEEPDQEDPEQGGRRS